MRFSTIAPIILALTVFPVSAEVYKWKTESGEIQYGQFPPAGVKAERMTASGLQSMPEPEPESEEADGTATGDGGTEQPAGSAAPPQSEEMTGEQPEADPAAQAEAARQEAQRKRQCASARNDLTILQQGGHRRMRLPDGTVTRLSPEDTEQRITAAQAYIDENCS